MSHPTQVEPAIIVDSLTKRFGARKVLDDLTFAVPAGTVTGFVGPNGAGKTTTLKILVGLVRATAGRATVLGKSINEPAAYLRHVGALIEGPAFYAGLSGERNLEVIAATAGHDRARVPELLGLVGLGDRGGDRYKTYSLGMKQRLAIAAALLGDPALLVLDEPSNGLDPAGIRDMRELIRSLASRDRTILVSSHLLAEVEQLCDWLVMIDRGRLVHSGPTIELLASHVAELVLTPEYPHDRERLAALCADAGHCVSVLADGVHVHTEAGTAADLNRTAMQAGICLVSIVPIRANLEERYLTLTSEATR